MRKQVQKAGWLAQSKYVFICICRNNLHNTVYLSGLRCWWPLTLGLQTSSPLTVVWYSEAARFRSPSPSPAHSPLSQWNIYVLSTFEAEERRKDCCKQINIVFLLLTWDSSVLYPKRVWASYHPTVGVLHHYGCLGAVMHVVCRAFLMELMAFLLSVHNWTHAYFE